MPSRSVFISSPHFAPTCFTQASKGSRWLNAISEKFNALVQNHLQTLVPPPPNVNIVGNKQVYQHKYGPNGSIDHFKARLVAEGFSQQPDLDYTETFSPVIKLSTVHLVLPLALLNNWCMHQLDVFNAFLHGKLNEVVYMRQPRGFEHPDYPYHVCKLRHFIYRLKQSPRTQFT